MTVRDVRRCVYHGFGCFGRTVSEGCPSQGLKLPAKSASSKANLISLFRRMVCKINGPAKCHHLHVVVAVFVESKLKTDGVKSTESYNGMEVLEYWAAAASK